MTDFHQLVDDIYEASFTPEIWPGVFDRISRATDSAYGLMVSIADGQARSVGTDVANRLIDDFNKWGPPESNPRIFRGGEDRFHTFLTDFDIFSATEIEESPFYRDFMRPRGFGWFAGTWFGMPTGDTVITSFERLYDTGPYQHGDAARLNALRPHLARASMISSRLALQNASSTADALARLGLAAAVLSGKGHAIAVNPLLEEMIPHSLRDGRERISFVDPAADTLFRHSLTALGLREEATGLSSFPVQSRHSPFPTIAHVVPLVRSARDIFANAAALLIVTPISGANAPPETLLRSLFDLTPTEAGVARALGQGQDQAAIAVSRGVSIETVRSQTKSILAKTGLNRQAELTALLAAIPNFPLI